MLGIRQRLAYLNSHAGSGLDGQMLEKHNDFWFCARKGEQLKPDYEIKASTHQKAERSLMSLWEFAQSREAAEWQRQEKERQQRQRQGPRLGHCSIANGQVNLTLPILLY